jgi:hypothetical protein
MWLAAILGAERLLRIDLDPAQGPVSFVSQALRGVREKLARWKSGQLPAYGRAVGVVVNYAPERAVRFDLDGNAIEVLDRAHSHRRREAVPRGATTNITAGTGRDLWRLKRLWMGQGGLIDSILLGVQTNPSGSGRRPSGYGVPDP